MGKIDIKGDIVSDDAGAFYEYFGKFQLGLFNECFYFKEFSLFFFLNLNIAIAGFRSVRFDT